MWMILSRNFHATSFSKVAVSSFSPDSGHLLDGEGLIRLVVIANHL